MNWRKRLRQWVAALRMAGVRNVPWLGLISAILSGPVPRSVWRARMRTCMKCPLYSKPEGVLICRSTHPDMLGLGCSCYLPFTAMTAKAYENGCFGRDLEDTLGWPNYAWPKPSEQLKLLTMIRDIYLSGRWTIQRASWARNSSIKAFHPPWHPFVQMWWEWKSRWGMSRLKSTLDFILNRRHK